MSTNNQDFLFLTQTIMGKASKRKSKDLEIHNVWVGQQMGE